MFTCTYLLYTDAPVGAVHENIVDFCAFRAAFPGKGLFPSLSPSLLLFSGAPLSIFFLLLPRQVKKDHTNLMVTDTISSVFIGYWQYAFAIGSVTSVNYPTASRVHLEISNMYDTLRLMSGGVCVQYPCPCPDKFWLTFWRIMFKSLYVGYMDVMIWWASNTAASTQITWNACFWNISAGEHRDCN